MGKVILGESAVGSPAIVARAAGNLLLAWTGTNSAHNLNLLSSTDGTSFLGKQTWTETSPLGPAVTSNGNGTAWISWIGTGNLHLNVVQTTDGRTYQNKTVLSDTSASSPALAYGNGVLYLAWTGTDSARSLNIMQSTDGINWHSKVVLGQQASGRPALLYSSGVLYIAWTGTDANRSLNVASTTTGGAVLNSHVVLNERSNFGPAIASGPQGLVLAWTGLDAGVHLNRDLSTNQGASWGSKKTFGDNSVDTPFIALFQSRTYIAWTGTNTARSINVATLEDLPLIYTPPQKPPTANTMRAGTGLHVGDQLVANNGLTQLTLQGDGNLVLYRKVDGKALWSSGTAKKPVVFAVMQGDGNLVCYDAMGKAFWATGTSGHPGAYAVLQNDGNFVIYGPDKQPLWASHTVVSQDPLSWDSGNEHLATGEWMHTWASMAPSGLISGHTRIWTTNELSGFHGSALVLVTDANDRVIWPTDPNVAKHNYGVDGTWIVGKSSDRTEYWTNQVDAAILPNAKMIAVVEYLDGRNMLLQDVELIGKLAAEVGPIVKAIASVL